MKTPLIALILVSFIVTSIIGPVPNARANDFALPKPGVMVHLSPPMNPAILKGIKVHPDNPFQFDFIMDTGDVVVDQDSAAFKDEANRLIKYFLASLTIPEQDLWVNLSPYEKDKIIPNSFGLTEMGRDLLAEDYMLKQITASLIYPEDEIGKKFWKRIYEEAKTKYNTTNIPVNTFNKVWIVPEKAVVYENAKSGTAYVVESRLKVMLECDYLLAQKDKLVTGTGLSEDQEKLVPVTNLLGTQIIREIVIPELTKEINENQNFAKLRQVYNSLILATWYKKKIKDSILAQVYTDKSKTAGININDPKQKEIIYQQYLQAFKKGTYNYIKDEIDPISHQPISRKYFSGGFAFDKAMRVVLKTTDQVPNSLIDPSVVVKVDLVVQKEKDSSEQMLDQIFSQFAYILPGQRKEGVQALLDLEDITREAKVDLLIDNIIKPRGIKLAKSFYGEGSNFKEDTARKNVRWACLFALYRLSEYFKTRLEPSSLVLEKIKRRLQQEFRNLKTDRKNFEKLSRELIEQKLGEEELTLLETITLTLILDQKLPENLRVHLEPFIRYATNLFLDNPGKRNSLQELVYGKDIPDVDQAMVSVYEKELLESFLIGHKNIPADIKRLMTFLDQSSKKKIHLFIGSGRAGFETELALQRPEELFIVIDKYPQESVYKEYTEDFKERQLPAQRLKNVVVLRADMNGFIDFFPDGLLDTIGLIHPVNAVANDLITLMLNKVISKKLKSNGEVYIKPFGQSFYKSMKDRVRLDIVNDDSILGLDPNGKDPVGRPFTDFPYDGPTFKVSAFDQAMLNSDEVLQVVVDNINKLIKTQKQVIVLVDGYPGSGKSIFSNLLNDARIDGLNHGDIELLENDDQRITEDLIKSRSLKKVLIIVAPDVNKYFKDKGWKKDISILVDAPRYDLIANLARRYERAERDELKRIQMMPYYMVRAARELDELNLNFNFEDFNIVIERSLKAWRIVKNESDRSMLAQIADDSSILERERRELKTALFELADYDSGTRKEASFKFSQFKHMPPEEIITALIKNFNNPDISSAREIFNEFNRNPARVFPAESTRRMAREASIFALRIFQRNKPDRQAIIKKQLEADIAAWKLARPLTLDEEIALISNKPIGHSIKLSLLENMRLIMLANSTVGGMTHWVVDSIKEIYPDLGQEDEMSRIIYQDQAMLSTFRGIKDVSLETVLNILKNGERPRFKDDVKVRNGSVLGIGLGLLSAEKLSMTTRFNGARMYAFGSHFGEENYRNDGRLFVLAATAKAWALHAKLMLSDAVNRLTDYKFVTRKRVIISGTPQEVLNQLEKIKIKFPKATASLIYKAQISDDQIAWKAGRYGHYVLPQAQEIIVNGVNANQIETVWVYLGGLTDVQLSLIRQEEFVSQVDLFTSQLEIPQGYQILGGLEDLSLAKHLNEIVGVPAILIKEGVYSPKQDGQLSLEFIGIIRRFIEERLKTNQLKDQRLKILVIGSGSALDAMAAFVASKKKGLNISLDAVDIKDDAIENSKINLDLLKPQQGASDQIRVLKVKEDGKFDELQDKYDLVLFNAPDAVSKEQLKGASNNIRMDQEVLRTILQTIQLRLLSQGGNVILGNQSSMERFVTPQGLNIDLIDDTSLSDMGIRLEQKSRVFYLLNRADGAMLADKNRETFKQVIRAGHFESKDPGRILQWTTKKVTGFIGESAKEILLKIPDNSRNLFDRDAILLNPKKVAGAFQDSWSLYQVEYEDGSFNYVVIDQAMFAYFKNRKAKKDLQKELDLMVRQRNWLDIYSDNTFNINDYSTYISFLLRKSISLNDINTINEIERNILPKALAIKDPYMIVLPTIDDWLAFSLMPGDNNYELNAKRLADLGRPMAAALLFAANGPHTRRLYLATDIEDRRVQVQLAAAFVIEFQKQFSLGNQAEARKYAGALINGLLMGKGVNLKEFIEEIAANLKDKQIDLKDLIRKALSFFPERNMPEFLHYVGADFGTWETVKLLNWNTKNKINLTLKDLFFGLPAVGIDVYRSKQEQLVRKEIEDDEQRFKYTTSIEETERQYKELKAIVGNANVQVGAAIFEGIIKLPVSFTQPLKDKIVLNGETFDVKKEFHVTLALTNVIEKLIQSLKQIDRYKEFPPDQLNTLIQRIVAQSAEGVVFSARLADNPFKLLVRRNDQGEIQKKSVVALLNITGKEQFFRNLDRNLKLEGITEFNIIQELEGIPSHVTLFTNADPRGIGLKYKGDFEAISQDVPDSTKREVEEMIWGNRAMTNTGGIDFTANKTPLEIQNAGAGIKFNMDPAKLKELQAAPGFTPIIVNIQPLTDLRQFLGISTQAPQEVAA